MHTVAIVGGPDRGLRRDHRPRAERHQARDRVFHDQPARLHVPRLGVGAFSAGIFHLMTHAFFKGLLFLASGSVIHSLSGEQDMRKMGGLRSKIKITYACSSSGPWRCPASPPFAGFFSKDEILWSAYNASKLGRTLWVLGVAGAFMTAFYSFRLIYLTFWGELPDGP